MRMFWLLSVVSGILLVPEEILADTDNNFIEIMSKAVHLAAEVNDINSTTNIAGWDVQSIGTDFPCDLFEWSQSADNVNELTPYDVSVVGAIGDSMTAAFAAEAKCIFEIMNEYRGLSWSIGGDDDLSTVATLPNVIKKYNPDLKGFSIKTGGAKSENARLNVAVSGAKARGMRAQAETLVTKMKEDETIDFDNDWKVVTMWIGGNDLCASCIRRKEYSPDTYIGHITETLDYFQENMPRALINLVQIIDISRISEVTGCGCKLFQSVLCPCSTSEGSRKFVTDYAMQYQEGIRNLISSGRYDTKNDFTVVLQPFMQGIEVPTKDGKPDRSYAAPDCFHFSTKSQALAGVALWNNMVQPVGEKATDWSLEGTLQCPSEDRPYFYTNTNSRSTSVGVQSGGVPPVLARPPPFPKVSAVDENLGSPPAANEHLGSPSTDGSSSLWVAIGTVTGVVVCVALAVAVIALVARFKRRRASKKDENLPLMESVF